MVQVKDIVQFNSYFSQPTAHPLIAVGDLSRADQSLFDPTDFGMYCVVLMDTNFGDLSKDGKRVTYRSETLFSLRPGQMVALQRNNDVQPRGMMLAFRPELLEKTGLGRDFYMFQFFFSDILEAIEPTRIERNIVMNCFSNLLAELNTPRDYMSDQLLRLGIGQLLSYVKRFYERQFTDITRSNTSIVQRLDHIIDNYLSSGLPAQKGQPTVAWCAAEFNLTPNYFGELMRRELHITAQEYIQQKIIAAAKRLLDTTALSVTEIAEELGFAYPNHFTRMFSRRTGLTPLRYRHRPAHSID